MVTYLSLYGQILWANVPPEIRGETSMAACDICGKSRQFGHNVSHSKRRTNHHWMPNVQPVLVEVDGVTKRVRMCTRCLRTMQKTS